MTELERAFADVIDELAEGEVVTYGWVAAAAGHPGAGRVVGNLLAKHGDILPWWRVVGHGGRLVSPNAREQARRLRAEGAVVEDLRVLSPARSFDLWAE